MNGPSSRMIASYGGLAFAATSFETVSTASEATRLTCALLVARRKAGIRIERCASSHAPGYVVADRAPCPKLTPMPEVRPAAAKVVRPLRASRRVMPMVMSNLLALGYCAMRVSCGPGGFGERRPIFLQRDRNYQ